MQAKHCFIINFIIREKVDKISSLPTTGWKTFIKNRAKLLDMTVEKPQVQSGETLLFQCGNKWVRKLFKIWNYRIIKYFSSIVCVQFFKTRKTGKSFKCIQGEGNAYFVKCKDKRCRTFKREEIFSFADSSNDFNCS